MKRTFFVLFSVFVLLPCISFAGTVSFTADHTCKMGNNDSKNDARRVCFISAKNKLLKKSGAHILKLTKKRNYQLNADEIIAFSAALINIETANEDWTFEKGDISLTLTVKTEINNNVVKKNLVKIGNDLVVQGEMMEQYKQVQKLEHEYMDLHQKLVTTAPDKAIILRKELQAVSEKIDSVEAIKNEISSDTLLVSERVEKGMTVEDVVDIAGNPKKEEKCRKPEFYNYGRVWVHFENGVVSRLIPADNWAGPCKNYDTEQTVLEEIQLLETGIDDIKNQGKPEDSVAPGDQMKKDKFKLILNNGKTILTPLYYPIDDVIYYELYGEIVGIQKSNIKEIKPIDE